MSRNLYLNLNFTIKFSQPQRSHLNPLCSTFFKYKTGLIIPSLMNFTGVLGGMRGNVCVKTVPETEVHSGPHDTCWMSCFAGSWTLWLQANLSTHWLHHTLLFDSREPPSQEEINRCNGLEVAPFSRELPECPSEWTPGEGHLPQEAEWGRRCLDHTYKPVEQAGWLCTSPFSLGLSFLICKMKGNWLTWWLCKSSVGPTLGSPPGERWFGTGNWEQLQPSDPRAAQLLSSLFVYVPTEISFKPRTTKLKKNCLKAQGQVIFKCLTLWSYSPVKGWVSFRLHPPSMCMCKGFNASFLPAHPSRKAGALTPGLGISESPTLSSLPSALTVFLLQQRLWGAAGLLAFTSVLKASAQEGSGVPCFQGTNAAFSVTSGTTRSQGWRRSRRGRAARMWQPLLQRACVSARKPHCSRALTWTCSPWPAWSILPCVCIFGGLSKVN